MAQNYGALKVTAPTVGAVTVDLSLSTGTRPTVYSDAAVTTTTGLPLTVAAGTTQTVYFASPLVAILSVLFAGQQIADPRTGTVQTVEISAGQVCVRDYTASVPAASTAKAYPPAAVSTYLGANADTLTIPGGAVSTGGLIYLNWVPLPVGTVIGNLWYATQSAAVGATSAQCWIGAYSVVGTTATLITNAVDQATNFGSGFTAFKVPVTVLAGQSLTVNAAGGVFVALLSNAATTQASWAQVGAHASATNLGQSAGAWRALSSGTGQTTLPTSIDLTAGTSKGSYWVAVA